MGSQQQAALRHPASAGLSDREIARHVGVSFQCVADWKKRIYQTLVDTPSPTRTATRGGGSWGGGPRLRKRGKAGR